MKKILVTGGAGFIGSHLCQRLLKDGNYVICLDNLFTGSLSNIKLLMQNQNFKFVNHDVTEEYSCEADEIFNLACPASPPHYQFDPVKTIRTSVIGISNMLELAKTNNAKILQASTSEVYGDPLAPASGTAVLAGPLTAQSIWSRYSFGGTPNSFLKHIEK